MSEKQYADFEGTGAHVLRTTSDYAAMLKKANERVKELEGSRDVREDRVYLDGMRTGWNLGVVEDHEQFEAIKQNRRKQLDSALKEPTEISDCPEEVQEAWRKMNE